MNEKEALYLVLKRQVERNINNPDVLETLEHKIDVFYAADKITEEHYNDLIATITTAKGETK